MSKAVDGNHIRYISPHKLIQCAIYKIVTAKLQHGSVSTKSGEIPPQEFETLLRKPKNFAKVGDGD